MPTPLALRRVLCALALLATVACGGSTPSTPTPQVPYVGPSVVRGAVLEFTTSMPRGNGVLEFSSDTGAGVVSTTANASGAYTVTVPAVGGYTVRLNDIYIGTLQVTGATFRGDFLVDSGDCVSRYGVLTDARTGRTVSGAAVGLPQASTTSAADGSYRIDLGCEPSLSFSTTFIQVTHPAYQTRQQVVGRGVHNVVRLDLVLEPN